jgi:ubiquinone/menaquinone biosynthesis C-methylase UbiE
LTEYDKLRNPWAPDEFFATGVRDVKAVLGVAAEAGLAPKPGRALDFGCGVGRLTRALADRFEEVHGVDIAPSMLDAARKFNRHGDKCVFHLNTQANLKIFPDGHFDFICTLITLQHIEQRYALAYLREMLRVLAPKGVMVFQLPSVMTTEYRLRMLARDATPTSILHSYRKMRYGDDHAANPTRYAAMEMYGTPRPTVEALLTSCGARIAKIKRDHHASNWVSYRYFVCKP